MTEFGNPYRAPDINQEQFSHRSRWRRFFEFLTKPEEPYHVRYDDFLRGEMVFIEGVGFVIDTQKPAHLFAVSAGAPEDKKRHELVRGEAIRVKHQLANLYPRFASEIQRRMLTVVVEQFDDFEPAMFGKSEK